MSALIEQSQWLLSIIPLKELIAHQSHSCTQLQCLLFENPLEWFKAEGFQVSLTSGEENDS